MLRGPATLPSGGRAEADPGPVGQAGDPLRAGDRKLNHALYMMAMVQVRRPSAGQAYYRPKLAEGKSPKQALRCLKRRLSDAVYRCLLADATLEQGGPSH
jgi:hypothetical protein